MAQPSMRDFEVLGELGSGSYARVLHVRRSRDGQAFALKVMNKAFLVRNNKAEGARRERELLERLGGRPGVVGLHFAFQDASHLYLALDVCPGGDLQQQLARRPGGQATRQEARLWAAQLVLALAAVHAEGAVHRDVKPENVLLTGDGYVRLCDFGSAKRLGSDDAVQAQPGITRSRCGTFAGTAEYCAPELIQGKLAACVASDFWSLGCVIFHMLAGRPPFKGASEYLTYQQVLAREFTYPAQPDASDESPCGFDADARACCDALLVVDPDERLCTAEGMQAQAFFSGVPWETLWEHPAPSILPPPPPTAEADEELRVPVPPAASDATANPPWQLQPGELVLLSGAARRKRGASTVEGTLVLTSHRRLALLPGAPLGIAQPLLLSSGQALARLRAMDDTHLVVRADTGGDAFVELNASSGASAWVTAAQDA